jgi:hypothetical protein
VGVGEHLFWEYTKPKRAPRRRTLLSGIHEVAAVGRVVGHNNEKRTSIPAFTKLYSEPRNAKFCLFRLDLYDIVPPFDRAD